jgi:Flp pilus assembly protein TadD
LRLRQGHQKKLAAAIHRGRRLLSEERDQENLEFLEEAVQRFPKDAEIRVLYATALLPFRPDEVASEAAKAVELSPDDPVTLLRAGSLMLGRRQLDTARSYLRRARELVGPDFVLMSGLLNEEGVLAVLDGDFPLAEEKLVGAFEGDPESEPFAVDLVKLLATLGRRAEAVEVIDQALPRVKKKDRLERLREELVGDGRQ